MGQLIRFLFIKRLIIPKSCFMCDSNDTVQQKLSTCVSTKEKNHAYLTLIYMIEFIWFKIQRNRYRDASLNSASVYKKEK